MKNYAKITSFLIALLIVASGCSSSANTDGEVTIDVFQFKVELRQEFEEIARLYEEENPGVKVNIETLGGGSNYSQSLLTKFSSGNAPDIFNVAGPSEVEAYRDYLSDLSDMESVETALEGTLNGVMDGDEVLGVPLNQEGYGFVYNKEVFEQAGIDAAEILTFADLENAVEVLDSQKESLGIDAVFALPAADTWPIGLHLANSYLAPEFGDDISEAYNAETLEFQRSDELKRMLDLKNEYSVQPVLSLSYSQQVEELFSLGRVAMIKQGNWIYNSVHGIDPEFAENNIGIFPVPVDGYEGMMPVGVAMYWGVNSNADEEVIQASKDFLDWMNNSETGKQFVMEDFSYIPAYEGYDATKIVDPISQEIYKYAEAGKTTGWVFNGAPVSWPGEALPVNMQRYLGGDMTWDEVVSDSIAKWEELR